MVTKRPIAATLITYHKVISYRNHDFVCIHFVLKKSPSGLLSEQKRENKYAAILQTTASNWRERKENAAKKIETSDARKKPAHRFLYCAKIATCCVRTRFRFVCHSNSNQWSWTEIIGKEKCWCTLEIYCTVVGHETTKSRSITSHVGNCLDWRWTTLLY